MVATGRQLAFGALREPLVGFGWAPRAAGWFTMDVRPGFTGVLAISTAVEHSPAHEADVTIQVGMRDDDAERCVQAFTKRTASGYRARTWISPLGYLLPEKSWLAGERHFDGGTASRAATELAGLVAVHVPRLLDDLAGDSARWIEAVRASVTSLGEAGLCRITELLRRTEGREAAVEFVKERRNGLGARSDAAARSEREIAHLLLEWLATV